MFIKTSSERLALREGGRRLASILAQVAEAARPGVRTRELDALAERLIRAGGDTPAFKDYKPDGASRAFPATLCVSVNDEVVHGIPTERALREGDVVGLDLGLRHAGFFTDMALTVGIGALAPEDRLLIERTREALTVGISAARDGGRVGDIGAAIEKFVKPFGYGIVEELGGHGVGREVHEKPYIPNFGTNGTGPELRAGMVLAIEPMLTRGTSRVRLAPDQFTFLSADGAMSAHFEHTIFLTHTDPEILTRV